MTKTQNASGPMRSKAADKTICLGLPKGSLNTEGRGNTEEILRDAGYDIRGYTPGKERSDMLEIRNDPEIKLFIERPQNTPGNLTRAIVDVAIVGDDCVREEAEISKGLIKLADLEYGTVKVVAAVPDWFKAMTLVELFESQKGEIWMAEYPKLAAGCFTENPGYQKSYGATQPLVEIRGSSNGAIFGIWVNQKVQLIYSEGGTEEYLRVGLPIIDNVQSGESLKRAGGRILKDGELMTSSAGLYVRPGLMEDDWMSAKANDIKDKLLGVVFARKYYDVKFNVEPETREPVTRYIGCEKLALKGPTVSPIINPDGSECGYAFNIIIPKARFPEVSGILKREYGATGIVREDIKQLIR